MTEPARNWRDDDTCDALHEMRREEQRITPQYQPLRWIRPERESRAFRRRTFAFAGTVATLWTLAVIAWITGIPTFRDSTTPAESGRNVLIVKRYVPPPPKIERNVVRRKRFVRMTPVPDQAPAEVLAQLEPAPAGYFRGSTESYAAFADNSFHVAVDEPLSTFSADVDTASYSNVRRFLNQGTLPPRDAVRIEELINYFDYNHPPSRGNDPFGVVVEVGDCPWNLQHRLARITVAARRDLRHRYRGSNLVFLLDVSGSMDSSNKLPLVKRSLRLLADQLDGRDSVSIVVYAGASGLVLDSTSGADNATIVEALSRLRAGGGTAGAEGLRLAYRVARRNFIEGGVNRVILATDGDFNVGATTHSELLQIIENDARRGIFLTALGFGMGNYQDNRLEQLADRGNGNYAYIDDLREARKVLVEEIGGTLVTVAKDVKFQIEFNPREVGAYRLVGYENRLLAHRDFGDDSKDAGEIGAGHTVTVLYELVPPGDANTAPEVGPLRYQTPKRSTHAATTGELFSLKIRFKRPDERQSDLRTYAVFDQGLKLANTSDDFRFAAAIAAFGMRLRGGSVDHNLSWDEIDRLASGSIGDDEHGHRTGFVELIAEPREVLRTLGD